jgi:hypothetical protein
MHQYKNYPVYGIAVPGPGKEWYCKGLIFEPEDKVTEIKRLESAPLSFTSKKKAEEYALQLCRTWIDEQTAESNQGNAG